MKIDQSSIVCSNVLLALASARWHPGVSCISQGLIPGHTLVAMVASGVRVQLGELHVLFWTQ